MTCLLPVNLIRGIFLLSLLLLVACSTSGPRKAEEWTLVQPYHRPLAGIGGGYISGSIPVASNQVAVLASAALVTALQDRDLSLKFPDIDLSGLIPPDTEWSTDIARLPQETVNAYNLDSTIPLTPGRLYGISYTGMHDTSNNEFRYRISAKLYERGALSDWSVMNDNRYSGKFFIDLLANDISRQLLADDTAASGTGSAP